MQVIYRTLGSVFSNVETWHPSRGDIALMASHSPVRFSSIRCATVLPRSLSRVLHLQPGRQPGVEDFLGHYVANNALAKTLTQLGSGSLNTDDRTVIEFSLARSLSAANGFQIATVWESNARGTY